MILVDSTIVEGTELTFEVDNGVTATFKVAGPARYNWKAAFRVA